jgi:surface protein
MKKLLLLSALLIFAFSYGQTPITDSNIAQAIETCLSTNPINGMCSDSEYGAMPDWDVSQVTDMSSSFEDRNNFNGDISSWVVSGVTNMYWMFKNASTFNQPIGSWDVSSVTNMNRMFQDATNFNGDISSWDVSNVTDMSSMFTYNFAFNQPIGDWDVSSVTDMSYMFHTASAFNQPIGDWDVSSVTDMSWMFHNAGSFVQDISSWCVSNITSEPTGFSNGTQNFPESYKPVWGTCPSLGIDDLNQLDVSIYPNPTSDTVYINSSSSQLKVVVFDILGKQVLNKPNTNSVDVSSLSKGAYFIKVSDGINTSTKKFIKE